jgi:hypothetical protein
MLDGVGDWQFQNFINISNVILTHDSAYDASLGV